MTSRTETFGFDVNHIKRVWGTTKEDCLIAACEYVHGRPDTGPLSEWTFINARGPTLDDSDAREEFEGGLPFWAGQCCSWAT